MPYIPPETVSKAREMDLLTYLRSYEPEELVHFGGSTAACFCVQNEGLFENRENDGFLARSGQLQGEEPL